MALHLSVCLLALVRFLPSCIQQAHRIISVYCSNVSLPVHCSYITYKHWHYAIGILTIISLLSLIITFIIFQFFCVSPIFTCKVKLHNKIKVVLVTIHATQAPVLANNFLCCRVLQYAIWLQIFMVENFYDFHNYIIITKLLFTKFFACHHKLLRISVIGTIISLSSNR